MGATASRCVPGALADSDLPSNDSPSDSPSPDSSAPSLLSLPLDLLHTEVCPRLPLSDLRALACTCAAVASQLPDELWAPKQSNSVYYC